MPRRGSPHACLLRASAQDARRASASRIVCRSTPPSCCVRVQARVLRARTRMFNHLDGTDSAWSERARAHTRAHVCASAQRDSLSLRCVVVAVEVLKTEPTLSPRLVEARVPVPAQLPSSSSFTEARSAPKEGGGGGGGDRGDGGGGGKEEASAERSLTFRHQTAQTQSRHLDPKLSFPPSAPPPAPPPVRMLGNPFEDNQGAGLADKGGRVSRLGAQSGGNAAPHKGAAWADPLHRFYSMVGSAGA